MRKEKVNFSTLVLILFAIIPVSALLIINALQIPREQILLRTNLAFISQLIFSVVAFLLIKNKILKMGLGFWIISFVIWRIYNLLNLSIIRPPIADIFFVLFFITILAALYKEFNKKIKQALPVFFLFFIPIFIAAYITFISKLGISINTVYGVFNSVLLSASLTAMTFQSLKSKSLGYFIIAVADSSYLWQIRAGTYYIASWVEIIFIIAVFILTLLYKD